MCPSGRAPATESLAAPSCLRSAFEVIDADGDGKISREDLRAFYARGEDAASDEPAMIGSMITAADSNADGFVEYEEFERASLGSGGGDESTIMEEVFKAMDKDGDGMLSHGDLKSFMSFAGFDLSDEDIKAMIAFANNNNINHSGVSFQGLCKILAVDSR